MRTPVENMRRLVGCLFLTASLCGCISAVKPADIQQNHQTVVLARVVCVGDLHGQHDPLWPLVQHGQIWPSCLYTRQLRDARGQMITSPVEKAVFPRALSKKSRDQGWFYFVVNPGSYYLTLNVDTGDTVEQPDLYFSVPVDKPLVYAGTLVFDRKTQKQGWVRVGSEVMDHVADESATAKSVISGQFAGLGEMTPRLLVPYNTAALNSNQVVDVQVSSPASGLTNSVIKGVSWLGARMIVAPSGDLVDDAAHETLGSDAASDAAAGIALFLVTAPVAAATGEITEHAHNKKWAPYEAAFQKQVAAFHLEDKLQQALTNRLIGTVTNSTSSLPLHLEVEPYSIVLRGDRHQKFNLEVAARVRLSNATEGQPIWEHDYLYTFDGPDSAPAGNYQTLIPTWYGQHKLEAYRGDAGNDLMRRELESAVGAITDEVIGELYERSRPSSDPTGKNVVATAKTPPQSAH